MSIDKVKPLKIEDSTNGTEFDMVPTETDPTEDYLASKGIAFENSENTTIYGDAGVMKFKDTDVTTEKSLIELVSSASPGFICSRKGVTSSGTWLESDGIPTNTVGIPILLNNPTLTAIIATNETASATFTVEIYEHDGTTFTLIDTLTVTSSRSDKKVLTTPASLTSEQELAVKISSGTAKNIKVICLIGGDTIT
jgi:hypothetical protein